MSTPPVVIWCPPMLPAHPDQAVVLHMAAQLLEAFGRGTIPPPQPMLSRLIKVAIPSTWSN